MSSNLPENIEKLLKLLSKADGNVGQFRAYVKLLDRSYKTINSLGAELRKQERNYNKMKTDLAFFMRHRDKVDVLLRALRETYSNSSKALRTLEELAQAYPPQYVFDVCQLGSYRLGAVMGWSFLNMKSLTRMEADVNYVEAVLPAIAAVLPDHRDYLALRAAGIEKEIETELEKLKEMQRAKAAVEAALLKWSEEMTALGHALRPAEREKLNFQELTVLEQLTGSGGLPLASSA